MEFTNRVAVVTGGGSGIGRAVVAAMARRDVAAVALVDVNDAIHEVAAYAQRRCRPHGRDSVPGRHHRRGLSGLGLPRLKARLGVVSLVRAGRGHHRDDWR